MTKKKHAKKTEPKLDSKTDTPDTRAEVDNIVGTALPQLAHEVWQDEKYYIQVAKYDDLNKFDNLNSDNELIFPTTTQPE